MIINCYNCSNSGHKAVDRKSILTQVTRLRDRVANNFIRKLSYYIVIRKIDDKED
jgi:hypothetical protein